MLGYWEDFRGPGWVTNGSDNPFAELTESHLLRIHLLHSNHISRCLPTGPHLQALPNQLPKRQANPTPLNLPLLRDLVLPKFLRAPLLHY